jgi:N-acetylglucosaminyl-diphospho-decaprenol L-rhamnosyltransferase
MSELPRVSVLVVSYNTRDLTRRCLASVREHAPSVAYEVVVVDNASGDGSAEMVAAEFPEVTLVRSERNVGFGPGVNLAARQARGDFLVLLNPDAEVLPGAFDALHCAAQAPGRSIVGGAAVRSDGTIDPHSCLGRPSLWGAVCFATGLSTVFAGSRWFDPEALGGWDRRTPRVVPAVSGCFVLVPRAVFTRLGGFDEAFFMYGEDVDLCLRAAAAGHSTFYTPDATVRHDAGASSASRGEKVVLLMKGRATLVQRHCPPASRRPARLLLQLGVGLRHLVHRAARRGEPHPHGQAWQVAWDRRTTWRDGYFRAEAAQSVSAP